MGTDLEALYRDLHANPELSFQEHRTANICAEHLAKAGFEVLTGIGGTGVVGVLRNGDGPVVLLRADMDALPVQEATGLDYASTATGTDPEGNTVPVMHACGHDMHVTCLIGAGYQLADRLADWTGTVIALFQPAEEIGAGAQAMVDDGLFDKIPKPDVVLGQHVFPVPAGALYYRPGVLAAASDSLRIRLFGRGGHGSRPETTVDPVVMAASVVLKLQTIVSRRLIPTTPAVVTVGQIHAGSKENVIPDEAELGVSVRSFDEESRATILAAITQIVEAEAQSAGAPRKPEIETLSSTPATNNDPVATERLVAAFADVVGRDLVVEVPPQTGSEDFGRLGAAIGVPSVYWAFGGCEPTEFWKAVGAGRMNEDIPSNHSPHFAPAVQPTLDVGVRALVAAALAWVGTTNG
ncbi:amidohydrolase [Pseudonocardiaceae bacterium YIM PH 21723]|nr:amidohydrolase [Pseudonocardiaceae bacterium YIM PH 21723]